MVEQALVRWARREVTVTLARVATDARCTLLVGDVADVLSGVHPDSSGPWDATALDVDNGPDFLIHERNGDLYTRELLASAYGRLSPGGRLAIWCQGPSPALLAPLREISGSAKQHLLEVRRGERSFSYANYTLDRPLTSPGSPG